MLDLPPEPVGSTYNVSYTVITGYTTATPPVAIISSPRVWTYAIGSGVYPELDTYTTLPENDPTVFQIMPPLEIRKNNVYSHNNSSRHINYDEYAKDLGIPSEDLANAFAGQSNMDKLDHITVSQGIDLKAKDKHSIRYCIDFLVKLKALADTHTFNYAVNGTADNVIKGFNVQETLGIGSTNVATDLVNIPGVDLIVSFDAFAYGLKYSHIDIQHHTPAEVSANTFLTGIRDDAIDESEHGRIQGIKYKSVINNNFTLTGTLTGVTLSSGIWSYLLGIINSITVSTITYYRINKDNSIDTYMIVQPIVAHYVRDAASQQHKLVYIDLQSSDGDVYLPFDWRIVKKYNNQALTSLVASSMHLTMYYAYWEQKEVWNWGLIIIVVAIVVFIYTGYDISAALAETTAALATTLGVTVVTAQIIMAVSFLASMGVFGEDYVILGQVAMLAISMGTSASTLGANAYTAGNALQAINIMNTYKMQHIMDEAEEIANMGVTQQLLQDEIQDGLDQEYEDIGYYYNKRLQKYITQGLMNIAKVDEFNAMPSNEYFQRVKKSVSPRYGYRLQYKYS